MTLSPRLRSVLSWVDDNILLLLSTFLIVFIPLYPKIPLFSPIEQYIVRVRLEDILVFLTGIVWLVQVYRQKITWKLPVAPLIFAYAVAGMLTIITAIFVIQSIPLQPIHVGKSLLHYFRYMEYFSLFFFLATAVKTRAHLKLMIVMSTITLLLVSLYGIGQKYYYWPVYSTMNREFSKGIRLYLTPHARVQSTFAGHYDLGAYLVIMLPIVLGSFYVLKNRWLKLLMGLSFVLGLWLLVVSASRTSFVAALAAMSLVVVLQAALKRKWYTKIGWGVSRLIVLYTLVALMMFQFGDDIYERLLQVIDGNPTWHKTYHGLNAQRKEYTEEVIAFVTGNSAEEQRDKIKIPKAQIPEGAMGVNEAGALVASDERPTPNKPSDVYVDVPEYIEVATVSATGEKTTVTIERERVFSDCANQRGLSLCIRLETLWPKAVAGFYQNPFFGKGYATLNKDAVEQFTEAESTDNNFLRTLGETGLVGFLTFYGAIAVAALYLLRQYQSSDLFEKTLIGSYMAATLGLLLNAVYIDVFAASKVAFIYWALTGVLIGYFYFKPEPTPQKVAETTATPLGRKDNVPVNRASAPGKKTVKAQTKSSKKKTKSTSK